MATVTVEANKRIAGIIKEFWNNRLGFVRHIIGVEPTPQQVEALTALDTDDFIAIKSGIGTGKSTMMAWMILHYMSCRPAPKIVCTSPSKDQLRNVLWPELLKWHNKMNSLFSSQFVWRKESYVHKDHEEWFAVARTATKDNPEAMQGLHSEYLLRILDEGSGIPEEVFEVIEGATGTKETKELLCGNPTRLDGTFFDAFNKSAEFYKTFSWSSLDSPIRPERVIERIRRKYGEDSNMWLVRVLGQFPRRDGDSYIPYDWAMDALNRDIPSQKDFPKVFGCDIARYGCFDKNTEILTKDGWKFFIDLTGEEEVLSLDVDTAVWKKITKVHRYNFNGYLNLLDRANLNFCITDNHNLVVKSNPKSGRYIIKQLQTLPKQFAIKGENIWNGKNPETINFISEVAMPHGGIRTKEWKFDFTDWAKFLGWYVSEGSVYKEKRNYGRYRIMIAQKKERNKEVIRHLLHKMGITFRYKGLQFEFSNNEIGSHLIEHCCGRQNTRRVPKYIKEASSQIIEAFLETYALGDGSNNSSGTGRTYFSCSSLLMDDIQEMLVKLGRAGKKTLKNIKDTMFTIEGREIKRRHNTWCVYELSKPADKWVSKEKIRKINYTGFIYCVSTPHKTIMVRRNGCVMWSGNSDASVIAVRQGDEFLPYHILRNKSTMETAAYIAYLANKEKPVAIFVDSIGVGGGVVDRLEELSFPVIGVNVAESPALDGQKYKRLRDELWGQMRDWFEARKGKIWDNQENDLVGELTSVKYRILSNGKIQVETKDEMKKRGLESPNLADSAIMTFAQPVSNYVRETEEFWADVYGGGAREPEYALDAEAGY